MRRFILSIFGLLFALSAYAATDLTAEAVNAAQPTERSKGAKTIDPLTIKAQVLLDRAHFSPGEIDGKSGENFQKAIRAFAAAQGMASDGNLTNEVWAKLSGVFTDPVLREYLIAEQDLKGPFLNRVPSKLEEMKDLPALGYKSVTEAIAEKFHMSEELLTALNLGKKFNAPGEVVMVANVALETSGKGSRIEVDKQAQTLKVLDGSGNLLAVFPATIGSEEKPAPSGSLRITSIFKNPTYRYDPEYRFKGVKSRKPFTIQPGPNNPVGTVWIGLSMKGYGIHGTPNPEKISKTESNGCVRLTNWDAEKVSGMMQKGSPVVFLDGLSATTASIPASEGPRGRKGR